MNKQREALEDMLIFLEALELNFVTQESIDKMIKICVDALEENDE